MVNKEFFSALDAIEKERRISKESLIESLEAGMISAFKKEYGETRNISVNIDEAKHSIKVYSYRTVVENDDVVEDYDKEITLEEAREIKPSYNVGDTVIEEIPPEEFSRIAAQTAKQVILQRLNDIKKDMVVNEMNDHQGEIVSAVIRRIEQGTVYVEITSNQMEGVLMLQDQIPGERYEINDTIKVYLKKIRTSAKGAQVVVSRASAGLVRRLFENEVPEIKAGLIQIKSIVREAGFRTKIAVYSEDPNIDATGACIGNKGVRVNEIVGELGGEKVDVILWCEDPLEYIARALSPAQVLMVRCVEDNKTATVIVPDDKLSLAIGKSGQNARLAAKLTGWKIDVKPQSSLGTIENEEQE
ncbi:MAG: transcription termination factor NusA [Acidaminococcus sp.]|nr:transcription termination factor NusA [Acidaminococcus sp.]MDD7398183.1 transcription termination factor NusA [Bacillota bacterium]MDY4559438.1 transcription termination factor NusA [Eubacteriales bacterium]MDY5344841.1 transcription termination factor NusA [Eubacteriales bacterium]